MGNFAIFASIIFHGKNQNVQNPRNIVPPKINPYKLDIILEKYLCGKLFLVKLHHSGVLCYKRKSQVYSACKITKSWASSLAFLRDMSKLQLHFLFRITLKCQTSNIKLFIVFIDLFNQLLTADTLTFFRMM